MAIAAHIASGMADVGIGVETAAFRCGLAFIPLARERYFFAVHRDTLETPAMQRLLALMTGDAYRAFVSQLVGYDATYMGQVQTLHEAFGPAFPAHHKLDARSL
jgi:molybdate-binding protein